MSDTRIITEEGQDIWGIAVKQYGSILGAQRLVEDNGLAGYSTDIAAGTELLIKSSSTEAVDAAILEDEKIKQDFEAPEKDYYITLESEQNIWDVAIQEYGSILGAQHLFSDNRALADYNDNLGAGMQLKVKQQPADIIDEDKAVMDYYRVNKVRVATGEVPLDGIPYMIIESTFITQ